MLKRPLAEGFRPDRLPTESSGRRPTQHNVIRAALWPAWSILQQSACLARERAIIAVRAILARYVEAVADGGHSISEESTLAHRLLFDFLSLCHHG